MKFGSIILSFCILAAFFLVPVFALDSDKPLEVKIVSDKDAVFPGDCSKYTATVTNNAPQQRVDFAVDGIKLSWIALSEAYYDFINVTRDTIFYICPQIGTPTATYNFVFNAKGRTSNYAISEPFAIYVIDRPYLEIRDIATTKEVYGLGEAIDFTVNVRNLGLSDAKKVMLLVEATGINAPEKQRIEVPLIEANRGSSASGKFEFDRYTTHGDYIITASIVDDIGDVLYKKSKTVNIEEKSELKQETIVKNSAISKAVTLKGANIGNKKDTVTLQSSGLSFLALYAFERQPDLIEYSTGKKIFNWNCELAPGESCSVSYRVEYWLLVITVLAALGILYVVYNIIEQPQIMKRIIKVHDREHTVHITIKNRSRKPLHEVHVVDTVPEIVSIVPNSFSPSIKPTAKGKKGGHELTWTFAKLEPKEERVITYKIRPLVMLMGNVRLPKARIYAVDALGKKYRAESAVMVD